MIPINYAQLAEFALPEIIVAVTALIVLAVDIFILRKHQMRVRFAVAAALGSIGCAGAILEMVLAPARASILDGMLVASPLTQLVQIGVLILAILTLLISVDSAFTRHIGEFVFLILNATIGMMFLVGSQDLLVIFISLELLSLSLYILSGFDKHSAQASEAALKYFLFGGMSAAFLLFGFSLLYGLANSTSLTLIANAVHKQSLTPLLLISIVTTVIGLGFKVAAAPFHFWAPDVYQGAPTPSAAFIASGSKVASLYVFYQVMVIGFAGSEGAAAWSHFAAGWVCVIAVVCVLSMVLGNLAAIVQGSVRRLLAYSAIAHAGYMLLALVSHTQQSLGALLYYVMTYALATLGTFGVVVVVEKYSGGDKLSDFDGLSRRAPLLSFCLFIFLLSLAGIPPLAGFFGKFYLFTSVLEAPSQSIGLLWLVILAIAMSAVSLYYYLQVLKRTYVASPAVEVEAIQAPILCQAVIALLAGAVILLGCMPHLLLRWIY